MYANLFLLASLAILGWIPLIIAPTWSGSRRLAGSGFFPIYISVLYAFGVGALLMELGPGFIADFGSAEGVARLLARQEIAWVAWLHILAFDQVIALLIYRENMRRRYVPVPVQSALLFLTLMFGPLGYLAFVTIRVARLGGRAFAADEDVVAREVAAAPDIPPTVRQMLSTFREERGVTAVALVGIGLGLLTLVVAAIRGPVIAPEGDLMKPATFDLALGIFILSLIPWLPVSGFSDAARRRWRSWMMGLGLYAFAIETVQQFRGIDPRFSRAEPASQAFGVLFFFVALGITTLAIALGARAFEMRTTGRRGLLVLAARWAGASMLIGFLAGIWLSANQGRFVGTGGKSSAASCGRIPRRPGDSVGGVAAGLVVPASGESAPMGEHRRRCMGSGVRGHLVADGAWPGGNRFLRRGPRDGDSVRAVDACHSRWPRRLANRRTREPRNDRMTLISRPRAYGAAEGRTL